MAVDPKALAAKILARMAERATEQPQRGKTDLGAAMRSRKRPLREQMRETIPFLRRRWVPRNLTDVAVRIALLWETQELEQSYRFTGELASRGWDLPEETEDPGATLQSYLDVVERDRSESWVSLDVHPLADLLELEAGASLGPEIVPQDERGRAELAEALILRAAEALDEEPGSDRFRGGPPPWFRAAVIEDRLYRLAGYKTGLEHRVRFVAPEVAARFVARHHSALPDVNPRGALYDLGLEIGGRLVAVAAVTTPTGAKTIEQSAHVVEVSRVASDASVHGAASALVAKVLELVDASRRYGTTRPGLLVTYSLLSELGTSYKALESKGLRPVAFTVAKRSQAESSSRPRIGALADVPKIRWEGGAEAAPADKTLLRLVRPYRKLVEENRSLDRDDLKPLNVERLRDLLQAVTGSRPRTKDRDALVDRLLGFGPGPGSRGVVRRRPVLHGKKKGDSPLTVEEYIELYPDTPPHMVKEPGEKAVVDAGFVRASIGWPAYKGGYIHWALMDVRKYVEMGLVGWAADADTPFRVYVHDYDDWNTERLFVTEEQARAAIRAFSSSPPLMEDRLKRLGFRTA